MHKPKAAVALGRLADKTIYTLAENEKFRVPLWEKGGGSKLSNCQETLNVGYVGDGVVVDGVCVSV